MPETSDMEAVRSPRGKAHRLVPASDLWTGKRYLTAACGLPKGSVARMTEKLPVFQTAPEDRCRKCWPPSALGAPDA